MIKPGSFQGQETSFAGISFLFGHFPGDPQPVDPFGGAKPRLSRRSYSTSTSHGKKAPLRVTLSKLRSLVRGSRKVDWCRVKITIIKIISLLVLFLFMFQTRFSLSAQEGMQRNCTYSSWLWNVNLKKTVNQELIRKLYSNLTHEEIEPESGCTICEEDQEFISLPPVAPFRVCNKIKEKVKKAIKAILDMNEPIYQIIGYRPGKSAGITDVNGNRTKFSQHSFGTALDINPAQNGLYDNCTIFNEKCLLRLGGIWDPHRRGALTVNSLTVRIMKETGFKWGGEMEGDQKDFMHFSLNGK